MDEKRLSTVLFFTSATGIYAAFVIPYIYFASIHNKNASFEILVDDENSFEIDNLDALKFLRLKCEINIRSIPKDFINIKNINSLRFVVEPTLRAEYVYIGDVDILITRDIFLMHEHVFHAGLPYSNMPRPCGTRLSGLHFTRYDAYYPIGDIKGLISEINDDEILLFNIIKGRGLIYDNFVYANTVKIRPTCGLHMSINRLPFFDERLRVGWGPSYEDMLIINELEKTKDFWEFIELCNLSSKLVLANAIYLAKGTTLLGFESFVKLTTQHNRIEK